MKSSGSEGPERAEEGEPLHQAVPLPQDPLVAADRDLMMQDVLDEALTAYFTSKGYMPPA